MRALQAADPGRYAAFARVHAAVLPDELNAHALEALDPEEVPAAQHRRLEAEATAGASSEPALPHAAPVHVHSSPHQLEPGFKWRKRLGAFGTSAEKEARSAWPSGLEAGGPLKWSVLCSGAAMGEHSCPGNPVTAATPSSHASWLPACGAMYGPADGGDGAVGLRL
jgi:hypothetical protein